MASSNEAHTDNHFGRPFQDVAKADTLPRTVEEVEERARDPNRPAFTQQLVDDVAALERDVSYNGQIAKGGVAATTESLYQKQQNKFKIESELARKPTEEITMDDAARMQSAEVCT
jgi:hypothetical protein